MSKAKYDIGDKVYAGECEAIVTQVIPGNYMVDGHTAYSYEIAYSDTRLGRCIIMEKNLTKTPVKQENEPKYYSWSNSCECGVESVGGNRHSSWCPKYRKYE